MGSPSLEVQDLGKRYKLKQSVESYGRLTESLWETIRFPRRKLRELQNQNGYLWALKKVSLRVHQGEVVGFVGDNGAGKTTLLKILSRITEPTTGKATIHGRVRSLLEVGTGFHPELTGRENVYLNGAILGMRRADIHRRFDEIVAFAEVDQFLETPVKRYSTGMYVRLAFAVAAHLEPDILIVDEVLSVGDANFQKKCLGKIGQVSEQGRTVLFVSHNMAAVEGLCTRAFLLEKGEITFEGAPNETLDQYAKRSRIGPVLSLENRTERQGNGKLRLMECVSRLNYGRPGEIAVRYKGKTDLRNIQISIRILRQMGGPVLTLGNELSGSDLVSVPPEGWVVCDLEKVPLIPGSYTFDLTCSVNGAVSDAIPQAGSLDVGEGDFFGTGKIPSPDSGSVVVPHRWSIRGC